jgi:hypothetical protein
MVCGYHRKRNGSGAFLCLVVLVFPFRIAGPAVIMSIKLGHFSSMYPLLFSCAGISWSVFASPLCGLDTCLDMLSLSYLGGML